MLERTTAVTHACSSYIFLLTVLLGCVTQSSTNAHDEALATPPGAYNIVRDSQNGTLAVSFDLDEPYPAQQFLLDLTEAEQQARWEQDQPP